MFACLVVQGLAYGICRHWNLATKSHIPVLWGTFGGLLMMGVNAFHWAGTLWATIGGVCIGLLLLPTSLSFHASIFGLSICLLAIASPRSVYEPQKPVCNGPTKVPTPSTTRFLDGCVKPMNLLPSLKKENTHSTQTKGFPVR